MFPMSEESVQWSVSSLQKLLKNLSTGLFGNSWTGTVPDGKAYWYAEDGSLSEEATFDENGNLDGARIQIDEKGQHTETVCRKGTLLGKTLFSSDGKLELAEEYYEDGSRK
jgi:hypothetical protein